MLKQFSGVAQVLGWALASRQSGGCPPRVVQQHIGWWVVVAVTDGAFSLLLGLVKRKQIFPHTGD